MKIKKQDGSLQAFNPSKIQKRLRDQSKGLNVDFNGVFVKAISGVMDGMSTKEIDNLLAVTAANKIAEDSDYSKLASRLIITRQAKIIGVEPKESDFLFDFVGITSFLHKYSLKNDAGEPIELPHMMYERVSGFLWANSPEQAEMLSDELKMGHVSLATPQLINAGSKKRGGLMSCATYSLEDDSRDGMLKTFDDITKASSEGAGIGLHIHNCRSRHSMVSSFKDKALGVTRFCRMVEALLDGFRQGVRSGRAAVYLGVWHRDIEDFLKLRLQIGQEKQRVRELFTAVCFPDLFYQKLLTEGEDDDWYVFCPHEVKKAGFPALHDVYDEVGDKQWTNLYYKLVEAGLGHKTSVTKLWNMHLTSLVESGVPYTFNWDVANRQNPQKNIGIVRGYQLCIEYAGVAKPGHAAQCNLASIILKDLGRDDFAEIARRTKLLVRTLNRGIDLNKWANAASKNGGETQRSIGIGIMGLADYLAEHKLDYDSHEAMVFNERLMETIYTAAREESSRLAVEVYKESYPGWKGSDYEKQGIPMANSLLVCLMPTASSAQLRNVTEMFEPRMSNANVIRLDAGEFMRFNPYLEEELKELGLWSKDMMTRIIQNDGSIQNIDEIPEDVKRRHRTIWEIRMKDYIKLAALRQKNIDQGQSMNLYFATPESAKIEGALVFAWKNSLPTGSYYTRCQSQHGNNTSKLAGSVEPLPEKPADSPFDCFGCST